MIIRMRTIATILLLSACGSGTHPTESNSTTVAPDTLAGSVPNATQNSKEALSFRIIDAPEGTFGYDILRDGTLFIHQTNLPGQAGHQGCGSRADAEKLAAFVINKIKAGEMPPSITSSELSELGITH